MLDDVGSNGARAHVIRALREILHVTQREARAKVGHLPTTVKEGISQDVAEGMAARLEEAGATAHVEEIP